MNKLPKPHRNMTLKIQQSINQLREWVSENFPKGKELVWKKGPYKGRRATIDICHINWEKMVYEDAELSIDVFVKTERADKNGFIFWPHTSVNCYLDLYEWFEI